MDGDPDAIQRPVVRPVGRAEDQSVVLLFLVVILAAARGRKGAKQQTGKAHSRRDRCPPPLSNHCPLRPRRHPRPALHLPLPPEGSTPEAFWCKLQRPGHTPDK